MLDVTSDFAASDAVTVSALSFKSFSTTEAADNLELETQNDSGITATDDKTIATGAATV